MSASRGRNLLWLVSIGFATFIATIVLTVAIWPGETKLTAPLLCDPAHPSAVVVTDTWSDSEGTSTNYTLYCVGPRGAAEDRGFMVPMLLVYAGHLTIVTVWAGAVHLRRRRSAVYAGW